VIKSLKNENLLEQRNIVVFTASSDRKVLAEIEKSGVKAIFKKPFSVDDLTALIEKYRKNE
jgi:AmiR/NasT family two-component response regulator